MTKNVTAMHRLPTKALLFASQGILTREQYYHDYDLYELKTLYGEVLARCDGESTIGQIVGEFGRRGLDEYAVLSIIENAMFRGWVDLGAAPRRRAIAMSGGVDAYYPRHLSIEMTNVCNLRCKHCYREATFQGKFISRDLLTKWIDILYEKGLIIAELTGGEPLLHPEFFDILDHAARKLESVALLTNGTLVDEKIVERLRPYAEKMLVSVSIDSSTSEFHDRFRGQQGSWEKSTRAVRLLAENGFHTRVAMSVAPGNMGDVEQTLLMARDLGAVHFSFGFVMPFGRGAELSWDQVTREKLIDFMKTERKIKKRYHRFVPLMPERASKDILSGETNCGGGWRTGVMSPSGMLRPCLNAPEGCCDIGNLFEKGLEVFRNPIMRCLCETRTPTLDTCGECSSLDFCNSCWYRGLIGSLGREDCKWGKELKRFVAMDRLKAIQQDSCIVSKMSMFA